LGFIRPKAQRNVWVIFFFAEEVDGAQKKAGHDQRLPEVGTDFPRHFHIVSLKNKVHLYISASKSKAVLTLFTVHISFSFIFTVYLLTLPA
jgi:hypothetical protein